MAVSKAVRKGLIPTLPDGRIVPEVADRVWKSRSAPRATPRGFQQSATAAPVKEAPMEEPTTREDYFTHRSERERWAAAREKLEFEKAQANLIPAADVAAEWVKVALVVKNEVLGLNAKLKQNLPHLTTEEMDLVDKLCRDCLEELACHSRD